MTDPDDWSRWLGNSAELTDEITQAPIRLMTAALDRDPESIAKSGLRPLWHWLYFLQGARQSGIGADGHPQRGGFLPPISLPRRMWAGGHLSFIREISPGSQVRRVSTIESIDSKEGRSGALVFIKVRHDISDDRGIAVQEFQDIVYRDAPLPDAQPLKPDQAPVDEQFSRTIVPDPVLLFRYSALTFNAHRIHYDRTYAMQQEGYPGLVVHGPLIATLLLEQLQLELPGATIKNFGFKAISPLFDTAPFEVCGRVDGDQVKLWARGSSGQLAMKATAVLA